MQLHRHQHEKPELCRPEEDVFTVKMSPPVSVWRAAAMTCRCHSRWTNRDKALSIRNDKHHSHHQHVMQVSVAPRRRDESREEGLGSGGEPVGQNTHNCTDRRRPPRTQEGLSCSFPFQEWISFIWLYSNVNLLLYINLIFIWLNHKRNIGSQHSSAPLENTLMIDLCNLEWHWGEWHSFCWLSGWQDWPHMVSVRMVVITLSQEFVIWI